MAIDWTNFAPTAALAGGSLIGIAASMLVLLNGRIAGISGILGGVFRPAANQVAWRAAFLAGLLSASLVYRVFAIPPPPAIDTPTGTLVVAGLLVGIGTRYGAGCTSGHGVCGLARRSARSLAATAAFMSAGFATVFVARHLFGS